MSSPTKTIKVSAEIAEFMLDLPHGTNIKGASFSDGMLELVVESEYDFPDGATLIYSNDEYGNSALVGVERP